MKPITVIASAIALLFIAAGCSDDTTSPTPDPSVYSGKNGFVINGGNYKNVVVDCDKSSVEFLDALGDQRGIRLDLGDLDSAGITLTLALPGKTTTTGEFSWVDEDDFGADKAYAVIEGEEDVLFSSKSGKTTITSFGTEGHTVTGTFSGVVEDADEHEYTINGKFTALRVN
jgi:hypothetical protein